MICIEDAPVPEPKPDQVLIRMRAASVNPIDWKYPSLGACRPMARSRSSSAGMARAMWSPSALK
ncbi:MAG: hypothetical protein U0703_06495 [Anaerolineae bacterium]